MKCIAVLAVVTLCLTSTSGFVLAHSDIVQVNKEEAAKAFPKRGFSPYAGRNYPTRVFWGDQHVHTGWSADAGAFGCTLGPEEALRFARGEEVIASTGTPAKLVRRLIGLRSLITLTAQV